MRAKSDCWNHRLFFVAKKAASEARDKMKNVLTELRELGMNVDTFATSEFSIEIHYDDGRNADVIRFVLLSTNDTFAPAAGYERTVRNIVQSSNHLQMFKVRFSCPGLSTVTDNQQVFIDYGGTFSRDGKISSKGVLGDDGLANLNTDTLDLDHTLDFIAMKVAGISAALYETQAGGGSRKAKQKLFVLGRHRLIHTTAHGIYYIVQGDDKMPLKKAYKKERQLRSRQTEKQR